MFDKESTMDGTVGSDHINDGGTERILTKLSLEIALECTSDTTLGSIEGTYELEPSKLPGIRSTVEDCIKL